MKIPCTLLFLLAAAGAAQAEPRVRPMPTDRLGPFVRLADGGILTVDGGAALVSKDEGATWSDPAPMFPPDKEALISRERAILRTKGGTVLVAFMNLKTRGKGYWDAQKKAFVPGVRLDVWTVRSTDGGKTWTDAQCVQQGYSGAVRALVQAANGNVVLATQDVAHDPARHATTAYYSPDEGKTWKRAEYMDRQGNRHATLDVGGHGHHDGAIEPTVELLKDGRLWMLMRTGHDRFWQAFSRDHGVTWTDFGPSSLDASAAPGLLKRLASGRLLLAWNRLYPEGTTSYTRRGPDWHKEPASYHREELSVALSDDDGKTWGKPVVVARQPGKWLSYPYVFERQPGVLWLTTMQGDLRLELREREFLAAAEPREPGRTFVGPVGVGANLVVLPDGVWEAYRPAKLAGGFKLTRVRSTDEGRSWSQPEAVHDLPGEPWGGTVALLDRRGEVQLFITRLRLEGAGKRIAVDRFIDVWHLRSLDGRTKWGEPQRVFAGYTGSIQMALQLSGGRILLPLGVWAPGRAVAPPTGAHYCTTLYSDDDGKTWNQSPAQLTAPCVEGYNGNNYGACEPVAVERPDGQVWMLMRTQAGFLYESFSKDGVEWSKAQPSRFHSSNSPAGVAKLPDGRLVVAWNNCELPPRADGQGVYGGRDALHLALSDDGGKTWRGRREVYLDLRRNDSPPRTGDRGTAYPFLVVTKAGKVGVISGQGAGRRALALVDPAWLLQPRRADYFSAGLADWSVFTEFGPARGYWRDRAPGAVVTDHPDRKDAQVLHVRRATADRPGDGAVWNFPAGSKGTLTLRLRLEKGFGGAVLALNDRFFNPTDDNGEAKALFRLSIPPDGRIGEGAALEPGRWHAVELSWDLSEGKCRVLLDGREAAVLPCQGEGEGVSYLRVRSAAPAADAAGLLVEKVSAEVAPAAARGEKKP
jgi:hypothetical protein